ncbi:MAG: LysM peptidoglycan-binding domain-containing protein [Gammaproteobacteria bacterium]|nr:LysM peptidoglycan-binding domain-containing protein [Gammaproteobacteria bacterium]
MLKNSLYFILFLFLIPTVAYPLGLGDITVFSKLNEPLKVQINIIDSKSALLDELVVKNADIKTYRHANLPRPDAFNKVRFKTKKLNNGSIVVELTSRQPVREPFVTFIADLKWLSGHLNREYTFLLDPPELVQKQMYKKKSKPQKANKIRTSKKINKARTPRQATHRKIDYSAVIKSHVDGETYTIKRADTLWNIAKKVKPGNGVSTYQTMQALYALNPQAFIKNDINLIKQGLTLNIPTENEILYINGKAPLKKASKATGQTNSSLTKQVKSKAAKVQPEKNLQAKEISQTEKNSQQAIIPEDKAQLKIIPSTEVILSTPITSKDDLTTINRALKNSITTIKSLSYENESLSEEIKKLTKKLEQLDSHNKGLNKKLSSLTSQIDKPITSTKAKQANVISTDTKQSNTSPVISKDTPSIEENSSLKIDSTLATLDKPQSFIKKLSTNPIFIIALSIIIILILITLFIIIRSKRDDKKRSLNQAIPSNDPTYKETPQVSNNSETAKISVTDTTNNNSPSSLQGTDISDEKDEDDMDFFEYFEKKINQTDSEEDKEKSKPKSIPQKSVDNTGENVKEQEEIIFNLDIAAEEIEAYEKSITEPNVTVDTRLSEIDTYIAYGNYDEAEQRLLSELKNSPSNKKLHLKLFECYTFSNKRYEFIQHAEMNINILNNDMALRHRVESIFQKSWNEPLGLNTL